MVYKSVPNKLIESFSIIPAAELVEIRIESKIHNIQILANDFNGGNSLFSQIVYFFKFSFISFLKLSLLKDKAFWFCNKFLVIYQRLFS